jgi:positive regulator of sigma E activity
MATAALGVAVGLYVLIYLFPKVGLPTSAVLLAGGGGFWYLLRYAAKQDAKAAEQLASVTFLALFSEL